MQLTPCPVADSISEPKTIREAGMTGIRSSPADGGAVRRTGAGRKSGARPGPGLSQPSDQGGRAVPGGRADRRHGAHHLGAARRCARPEHRDREPRRRRRRQHRRQGGRDRRSRRLHHPDHARRSADLRPGRARQHRLRPGQGVHAGRPAHRVAADHVACIRTCR